MGTTIRAIATSRPVGPLGRSSLQLADRAASVCLRRSGHVADELDMLVNAGLYRRDSLGEPALAALIQDDIGADPSHPPAAGHGTFSFDLGNGPCGVLTSAYVLDGFMRSGVIQLGMTVASDVRPRRARGYRFPPVGGALLLGWDEAIPGFTAFHFATFPEYGPLFDAHLGWEPSPRSTFRRRGRNQLVIQRLPDYEAACLDCGEGAVKDFLDAQQLTTAQLDLVVTNEPTDGFPDGLADRLGLSRQQVARPVPSLRGAHTAGLPAALEATQQRGQLDAARTLLLVSVGAGITAVLAIYRR